MTDRVSMTQTHISNNVKIFISCIGSPNVIEQIEPTFWLGYQNAELIEDLLDAKNHPEIDTYEIVKRFWTIATCLDKRDEKTYLSAYTDLLLWVAYDAVHGKLIDTDTWGNFLTLAYLDGTLNEVDEDDLYRLLVDFQDAWRGTDIEFIFEELEEVFSKEELS